MPTELQSCSYMVAKKVTDSPVGTMVLVEHDYSVKAMCDFDDGTPLADHGK